MFQLSSYNKLPSLHANHPPDFSKTTHPHQINDLQVSYYDCRERLNVRHDSCNRVDDFSANPHDIANNKSRVDPYIRAKATINTGYHFSLLYTKDAKICGYNANTNHYHDRRKFYQIAMLRYHAVSHNDCQNHVLFLHFRKKQFNTTAEPPKPIAFLTDSDQRQSNDTFQGKLQATAFDQDVYGVWVYSQPFKYITWIPEASQNKHRLCKTQ